jgi:hypothetical protein
MPAILAKLLLSTAAVLVLLVATLGLADEAGKVYTEDGFKRALITYGIARGLNGVISVAQGTEVAVEPVGIGVTFTPGEILDPLNDLVERFSWIMLASGTSLGVQRVLLDVTAWVWFTALVGLALVAAALVGWWPGPGPVPPVIRRGVYRLALVLVILRFSVPLIAILGETLYSQFLEPQYAASKQKLEQTAETISTINDEARRQLPVGEDESLMASVKRAYASATGVLDVEERIEAFKRAAADVSEYAVNLIVVFVLQTILFPLLSVWLVIQLVKRAVTAGFPFTPTPAEG